ncbi:MAG: hypothetical protein KDJ97_07665 [Anaerolineae bacterium]|nr:hypothetical protein [Anaerolineae bacterium]MCB9101105.1 hypothetical protein [Anaerolineales bacterium]
MPKRIPPEIKRRVLIVENDLLLGAGVEHLLIRETNLEVIGISPQNEEELFRKIRRLQPEIIILDETTYLTQSNRLLTTLRQDHDFHLIIVNADKNIVYIYHKYTVMLRQISDLIEVLREK